MGRALQQGSPEFPFQPLQLLAQRGLDDVLAGRCAPEVQFLGESDEVAKLAKLHADHRPPLHPSVLSSQQSTWAQTLQYQCSAPVTGTFIRPADDRC
jgi:hypothetical protein